MNTRYRHRFRMVEHCTVCEHPRYHHGNIWKRRIVKVERIGGGHCHHHHCDCKAGKY